jgi:hypothetical protein
MMANRNDYQIDPESARIIRHDQRKHLVEFIFGWSYFWFTDRLWQFWWQVIKREPGKQISYTGDPLPTPNRPWWRLRG